jgi:hypothetical protein
MNEHRQEENCDNKEAKIFMNEQFVCYFAIKPHAGAVAAGF